MGIVDRFQPRLAALVGRVDDLPAHCPEGIASELRTMVRMSAGRTPVQDAWTHLLADHGATDVWLELTRLLPRSVPAYAQDLLDAARYRAREVTDLAKDLSGLVRPPLLASELQPVVYLPRSGTYPSGHTITAFAQAYVLAALDPNRGDDYAWLAREVGAARSYGGVHLPTDVRAGARLGVELGARLLRDVGIGGHGTEPVLAAVRGLDELVAHGPRFGARLDRILEFARRATGIDDARDAAAGIARLEARYAPFGYDTLRQPAGARHADIPELLRRVA